MKDIAAAVGQIHSSIRAGIWNGMKTFAARDPLLHYAVHGLREGRDPGPQFKTSWYLETYPDVQASGMNPLAHFIHFGRIEGRLPLPVVSEN